MPVPSFIVNRESFLAYLTAVQRAIAKRTPRPALACVRIDAGERELTLMGTDLETAVLAAVREVQVESIGTAVVNAELLAKLLKKCGSEAVRFVGGAEQLELRTDDAVYKLPCLAADSFPPPPAGDTAPDTFLDSPTICRMIDRTIFACARESFGGICLELAGDAVRFVASDGRRLAYDQVGQVDRPTKSAIVNAKAMKIVRDLAKPFKSAPVGISIIPGLAELDAPHFRATLDDGRITVFATGLEGQFPPYRDLLEAGDKIARCGTINLLESIDRAAVICDEEIKGIRFDFSAMGLELTARNGDGGEAEIKLPMFYRGEPLAIGFNPAYLADALKACREDEIELSFHAPNRPLLLAAGDFRYVLMPVNLQVDRPAPEEYNGVSEATPAEAAADTAVEPAEVALAA